ncbi:uncharacterized protein LOC142765096 isoform X1 [Rhipicephalus microplus]|uniref:uncharacterized protein LOC142765096 isoform X1 n=1 Tax=Rhipicephalus microplus TaxID=6941 RepID=UPI003F6BAA4B
MTSSDQDQTETVQPEADEKWVLLQDGGDAFKERLLEEQHGDAMGEKQNVPPELSEEDLEKLAHWCRSGSHESLSDVMGIIRNAAARLKTNRDAKKFLWWGFSGSWNDPFVHNGLWKDKRLSVLSAVLFARTVLHVLATVASLTESSAIHALLITLKHFTQATLSASLFSIGTSFLSLTAIKTCLLAKSGLGSVTDVLLAANGLILLVACYACIWELGSGITVFQGALREVNLEWFPHVLADVAMVYGLTASIVTSAALVFRMCTDVKATSKAVLLNDRVRMEYRKLVASARLKERARLESLLYVVVAICGILCSVLFAIFAYILGMILFEVAAFLSPAAPAASGGV